MAKVNLSKVGESITFYRYDNGFMIEISGRNKKEEWKTQKILCNTEDELLALIKEVNTLELDQ
jgi:hypothetical protein